MTPHPTAVSDSTPQREDKASPREDPRWRLAYAEAFGPLPEVPDLARHEFHSWGFVRQHEIEVIYDLGIPEASPLSFRPGAWRSSLADLPECDLIEPADWDPGRFESFWNRIVYYQIQIHHGVERDPRQVVRHLMRSRRWEEALRVAEHAARLRERHLDRLENGAKRYIARMRQIVMAAGGPCTYCGALDPRTVDHVMPTSRGGTDRRANLTIACVSCNSQKGNQTPEEWKAARLTRGRPWPPTSKAIVPVQVKIPA